MMHPLSSASNFRQNAVPRGQLPPSVAKEKAGRSLLRPPLSVLYRVYFTGSTAPGNTPGNGFICCWRSSGCGNGLRGSIWSLIAAL